jgi:hypothetical protein
MKGNGENGGWGRTRHAANDGGQLSGMRAEWRLRLEAATFVRFLPRATERTFFRGKEFELNSRLYFFPLEFPLEKIFSLLLPLLEISSDANGKARQKG